MKLPRRSKEGSEETPEAREQRRRERAAKAEQAAARAERRAAKAEAKAERRDKAKAAMRKRGEGSGEPAPGAGKGGGGTRAAAAASSGKRASGEGAEHARGGAAKRARGAAGKRAHGAATDLRKLGSGASTVLTEVLKVGREMLVIPAQLWIAAAEVVGSVVLAGWRRGLRPGLVAVLAASRAALRFGERHVTPGRAVTAVALAALAALAISQWLDYRAVSVGTDAYSGDIQVVAPAPEIETAVTGDAHGWVMVPLAAVGLAAVGFGLIRRPRAAHLLIVVGVAAIAISLIVDAPKGLDEGEAAIAYEGAKASLLEGFWLQIVAGGVLIACGLMLPAYLRPARASVSRSDAAVQRLIDAATATVKRGAAKGLEQGRKLPRRLPRKRPRINRGKRKVQGART